ncbi:MAG: T9SS type A sorting domain-containing protein [Flavobacteriaceae bacterium]|nr:T9SS type A sorting domain-containing protein [Flavobacteriaceae bacterium]
MITIYLPLQFNSSNFEIKIFDLNGRLVIDEIHKSRNGKIDMTGLDKLEAAPYFIRITHKDSKATIQKKLVKY